MNHKYEHNRSGNTNASDAPAAAPANRQPQASRDWRKRVAGRRNRTLSRVLAALQRPAGCATEGGRQDSSLEGHLKRFVETNRWRDPWFRRLSPAAKLLWGYLTDNCDCVGLIDLDLEAATFDIGLPIQEKHLAELGSRTQRTVEGKIFLRRFIEFQYGTLSEGCPAHKPVLKLVHLRHLTLTPIGYQYPSDSLSLGYQYSTGKDKDKEKDKERGDARGDSGGVQDELADIAPPTIEQIYNAYPRKVAKPEALRAIATAATRYGAAYLLQKTRAYAATQVQNDRFTPHPATWFNQSRFNDDPTSWVPGVNGEKPEPKTRAEIEYEDFKRRKAAKLVEGKA